jgi:hypothetical protein
VGPRGLPPPVPIPPAGAPGRTKALAVLWPQALRLRWGVHNRQNLQQKAPPQAGPAFKAFGRDLRDAPPAPEAARRRQLIGNRSQRDVPAAWRCVVDDAAARLTPLYVPQRHPP